VLKERGLAEEAEILTDKTLRISRGRWPTFDAGILSLKLVSDQDIEEFLGRSLSIVINVPKDGIWSGGAIDRLADEGIAFGGVGDLMSASNDEDVAGYVNSEFRFVGRGIEQHSRVARVERLADRVFKVHRKGAAPVMVLTLNEYDLTGDHIRAGKQRYESFDVVLKSNPNGRITKGAYEVADQLSVKALRWGELLSHLAKG
jgi:hypothetical protein